MVDKPEIIETQRFEDFRGWLSVPVDKSIDFRVVQINQGFSRKAGTLRGLHFQEGEHAQAKLVSCLHGSIFNVAVDLRPGDTFGYAYSEILSFENQKQMLIPRGFAHGYAKDYVECMWLIMQQDKPEDFVIATGVQHTVRDFTEKAFAANGITIRWEGTGIDEKGYDAATGKMLVCVNPQWFRPTDVDNLWGDPTKAKTVLGWNPQSTTYEQLVEIMAKHDRERAKREKALKTVL